MIWLIYTLIFLLSETSSQNVISCFSNYLVQSMLIFIGKFSSNLFITPSSKIRHEEKIILSQHLSLSLSLSPFPLCLPPTPLIFKLNLASVFWHHIKSQRHSLGWNRQEQLYRFARQRGSQWANALKTVCPNLKEVVRCFPFMVQKGHDQLVDILLMG